MATKPTLLVLAAGMGSRYGGLKQMDPMGPNGETVLDYSVFDAIRAGFGRVVFIIRRDFEQAFKEQVGGRFADRIQVDYAFQDLTDLPEGFSVPEGREKPWGTTHAIRAARNIVNEPFAVINADDFYGHDSYEQVAKFFATLPADAKNAMAMVGYPLENTLSDHGAVNRGVCTLNAQGNLSNVEEYLEIKRDEDGVVRGTAMNGERLAIQDGTPVSMNFWAFGADFFQHIESHFLAFLKERGTEMKSECYIPTVVDELITKQIGHCSIISTTSTWFGVTYPQDKPVVVESIQKLVDSGAYPSKLS